MTTFRKGDLIEYESGTTRYQGIVRIAHKDGSLSVETRFRLKDGVTSGCYIGGRIRMSPEELKRY